jgi:hypothetical protein
MIPIVPRSLALAVASVSVFGCDTDRLRSSAKSDLTWTGVTTVIQGRDFFDSNKNPDGAGARHDYTLSEDGQLVVDSATTLIWQRSSSQQLSLEAAATYIAELRMRNFAGHSDWRLPTFEEAASLVQPVREGPLYLSGLFDNALMFSDTTATVRAMMWTSDIVVDTLMPPELREMPLIVEYYMGLTGAMPATRREAVARAVRSW